MGYLTVCPCAISYNRVCTIRRVTTFSRGPEGSRGRQNTQILDPTYPLRTSPFHDSCLSLNLFYRNFKWVTWVVPQESSPWTSSGVGFWVPFFFFRIFTSTDPILSLFSYDQSPRTQELMSRGISDVTSTTCGTDYYLPV